MNMNPLLIALTLNACLLATPPTPPTSAPKETTAPEQKPAPPRVSISPAGRVDLGSLGPMEVKRITYTFTNTSEAPISFRVLDASPGVAVDGPLLKGPIPPKGQATLDMQVDATDWVGHQKRNVRLGTDDPAQGYYLLPSAFFARPDLTVDAEKKAWGPVAPHESPALSFIFKRETGHPLQLKLDGPLPPHLEAEFEPGKGQTELKLILHPAKLEPGVRVGLEVLQVSTNAPKQPKFTLYADWRVKWPVEANPQRLVFLDPKEAKRTLKLESSDGKPFRVLSVRLEGQGFKVAGRTADSITIQRMGKEPGKSLLWIEFVGQETPLKVPLAYLPPDPKK